MELFLFWATKVKMFLFSARKCFFYKRKSDDVLFSVRISCEKISHLLINCSPHPGTGLLVWQLLLFPCSPIRSVSTPWLNSWWCPPSANSFVLWQGDSWTRTGFSVCGPFLGSVLSVPTGSDNLTKSRILSCTLNSARVSLHHFYCNISGQGQCFTNCLQLALPILA